MGKRKSALALGGEPRNKMPTFPLPPRIDAQIIDDFIEEVESVLTLAKPSAPALAPIFLKSKIPPIVLNKADLPIKQAANQVPLTPLLPPQRNPRLSLSPTLCQSSMGASESLPISSPSLVNHAYPILANDEPSQNSSLALSNRFEPLTYLHPDTVISNQNSSQCLLNSSSCMDPTSTLTPVIHNFGSTAYLTGQGSEAPKESSLLIKPLMGFHSVSTQTPLWEPKSPSPLGSCFSPGHMQKPHSIVIQDLITKVHNIQQDMQNLLELLNSPSVNPPSGHPTSAPTERCVASKNRSNEVGALETKQLPISANCSTWLAPFKEDVSLGEMGNHSLPDYRKSNLEAYQYSPEVSSNLHPSTKRIIYLTNVPKLQRSTVESNRSLLDKVLYHFRITRRCLAVIRSDITCVRRFSSPNNCLDVVEVCFNRPFFVVELINLEHRIQAHDIPLPHTSIVTRLHFPQEYLSSSYPDRPRGAVPRRLSSGVLNEVD